MHHKNDVDEDQSNSATSLPPVPLVKKIEPITKTQPAIIFYIHYVIYTTC